MFLKAGLLSLGLLVASRLLGLLRESAQAAAFGATGLADAVVLMLTLPDLLTGMFAGGALSYVLLPYWAQGNAAAVSATQRVVARWLLGAGIAVAVVMALCSDPLARWLAPGVPLQLQPLAAQGMWWSAAAVPAALLAALWVTRLQHESDFKGMYGANLVVNGVLVAALFTVAGSAPGASIAFLGFALLLAALARLAWLAWRQRRMVQAVDGGVPAGASLPPASAWIWAALAAGAPLALPFVARTVASQEGEGALATFNYAWKLVELPLLLAIQLVATIAFPAIARSLAPSAHAVRDDQPLRSAFALAWTLACGAAAALLWGSQAFAQLLFGWGRMQPQALDAVAQWAALGAWGLLPQALAAVAMVVLAAHGLLRRAALAQCAALAGLLVAVAFGVRGGAALMMVLNLLLSLLAVGLLWGMGSARSRLPWRGFAAPLAALLALEVLRRIFGSISEANMAAQLVLSMFVAIIVVASGWFASLDTRAALRR